MSTQLKKNTRTLLTCILVVLLLIVLWIVLFRRCHRHNHNQIEGFDGASAALQLPSYFGNYLNYVASPNLAEYSTTNNQNRFTYTLDTNMRIDSIGVLPCYNISSKGVTINISYITNSNSISKIGDSKSAAITSTAAIIPSTFNISIPNAVTTFQTLIRVPRNEQGTAVVAKTLIITSTDLSPLPCELIRNMCFFGFPDSPDNYTEAQLYYADMSSNNLTSIATSDTTGTPVDDYIAYTIGGDAAANNSTTQQQQQQYKARFLRFTLNNNSNSNSSGNNGATKMASTSATATATATTTNACNTSSLTQYNILISYQNSLSGDKLINLRDYMLYPDIIDTNAGAKYQYIYFPVAILASKLIIKVNYNGANANNMYSKIELIGSAADTAFVNTYNSYYVKSVNNIQDSAQFAGFPSLVQQTAANSSNTTYDACPANITDIVNHQNMVQKICDSIEYQDSIKAEKVKLEREKQYLIKLKQQYDQIQGMQGVIDELQKRRDARQQSNDAVKLAQYQQQKSAAARIRDIATDRSKLHNANVLNLDVNLQQVGNM